MTSGKERQCGQGPVVLHVDDEPQAGKWFARLFSGSFEIATAESVEDALQMMSHRDSRIAVVVTDFRMPDRDGSDLIREIQLLPRRVSTILATACADSRTLISAVNAGHVFRIIQKPYDPEQTRAALHDAIAAWKTSSIASSGAPTAEETLAFVAHELTTPLAAVVNFARGIVDRIGDASGTHSWPEAEAALSAIMENAHYCASVLAVFFESLQRPHNAPAAVVPGSASVLLEHLITIYPFTRSQRSWISYRIERDLPIGPMASLVTLVISSLIGNAMVALRNVERPKLEIVAGEGGANVIVLRDNGDGISPEVLSQIMVSPITTRGTCGGNGMGMIFCAKIMRFLGGEIRIQSCPNAGTTVTVVLPKSA